MCFLSLNYFAKKTTTHIPKKPKKRKKGKKRKKEKKLVSTYAGLAEGAQTNGEFSLLGLEQSLFSDLRWVFSCYKRRVVLLMQMISSYFWTVGRHKEREREREREDNPTTFRYL
jgi:hypothetical protein